MYTEMLENLGKQLKDIQDTIQKIRDDIAEIKPWVDFPERSQYYAELRVLFEEEADVIQKIAIIEYYLLDN